MPEYSTHACTAPSIITQPALPHWFFSLAVLICAASSGESTAEEDDNYDDDDDAQPSEPTAVPELEAADAQGHTAQPSTSRRLKDHDNAGSGQTQPNMKDRKATGVARAAARLLEQDTVGGGLAILSVRYDKILFGAKRTHLVTT